MKYTDEESVKHALGIDSWRRAYALDNGGGKVIDDILDKVD